MMRHQAFSVLLLACSLCACAANPSGQDERIRPADAPGEWIEIERDLALYVERTGQGPTVILIEGAQMDMRQWDYVTELLARDHDVVRYDLRGFGRSDWIAGPFRHQDDLLLLMDELGIANAHLIGMDLGGRIAIDLALAHPDRVRSLVLAGTNLSGFQVTEAAYHEIRRSRRSADPTNVANAWLRHEAMAPSMEQYRLAPRIKELVRDNAQVWLRDDHEQAPDRPAIDHLGELEAPTLLLVGSRDARDNHNIALILETTVPLLVRRNVLDAGHLIPMERPEWFVAAVSGFLIQADIR